MRAFALPYRLFAALLLFAVLPACSAPAQEEGAAVPTTEDEKTIYAIGMAMAQNLGPMKLNEQELDLLVQGLSDAVLGREPQVELSEYGPKIQGFAQGRMQAAASAEAEEAAAFIEEEAAKDGVEKTESGIVYKVIQEGTGDSPTPADTVRVHYVGSLRDGTTFDSSRERGQPAEFPLGGVIPCWTEAVQKMKVGGKARIVCPPDLAYGEQGRPGMIPGGAALVFEIELLDIVKPDDGGEAMEEPMEESMEEGGEG